MDVSERPAKAGVLDNLAFAMLDGQVLISKLAHLFIVAEPNLTKSMGRKARENFEANAKYVAAWLRPLYTPPIGKVREMVALIVTEIARQKDVRKTRAANIAYRAIYGKTAHKDHRRNKIAANFYQIESLEWGGGAEKTWKSRSPSCQFIASYDNYLLALDTGYYSHETFLYTRHKPTGRASLVRIELARMVNQNLYGLFVAMATDDVRAAIFAGQSVTVDLNSLSFNIAGKGLVPWQVVGKPIHGDGRTPLVMRVD